MVEGAIYRLNMSDIISTSVSAFDIFSADESCGLPPKRNDILATFKEGRSCRTSLGLRNMKTGFGGISVGIIFIRSTSKILNHPRDPPPILQIHIRLLTYSFSSLQSFTTARLTFMVFSQYDRNVLKSMTTQHPSPLKDTGFKINLAMFLDS